MEGGGLARGEEGAAGGGGDEGEGGSAEGGDGQWGKGEEVLAVVGVGGERVAGG